jgi:hypothetical protein
MKHIYLFLGLIFYINYALGQSGLNDRPMATKHGIVVIAKSYGDSIVLRWSANSALGFMYLNKYGYKIERLNLSKLKTDSKNLLKATDVLQQIYLPIDKNVFQKYYDTSNHFAMIAAQVLYGNTFTTKTANTMAQQFINDDILQMNYLAGTMAAELDGSVAQAMALRYTDTNIDTANTYIYKIIPLVPKSILNIDTATVVIISNNITPIGHIQGFKALGLDKQVLLSWNRYSNDNNNFSYFFIEKSSNNGKTFTRVNELPFASYADKEFKSADSIKIAWHTKLQTSHLFYDSIPKNYFKYQYRIIGINSFGEYSIPSEIQTIMGLDLSPPGIAVALNAKNIYGNTFQLKWEKEIVETDFKGYQIERSINIEGPWQMITNNIIANRVNKTLVEATPMMANYFRIVCVDTSGNKSYSIPVLAVLEDTTAPQAPKGLKGKISKSSTVVLSWQMGKEIDLKLYKVYWGNASHTYSQRTPYGIADTVFYDTINVNTLTKNVFYKVVAIDQNGNHSQFSETLKLIRPDIVPPSTPIPDKVLVDKNYVSINWILPEQDLNYVQFYKREKNTNWQPFKKVYNVNLKGHYILIDTQLIENVLIEYAAKSFDSSGLASVLSPITPVTIFANKKIKAIDKLELEMLSNKKSLKLLWDYKGNEDYYFVIYRKINNGNFELFHSVSGNQMEYIDNELFEYASYQYAVEVHLKQQGISSQTISNTIRLEKE